MDSDLRSAADVKGCAPEAMKWLVATTLAASRLSTTIKRKPARRGFAIVPE